MPSETEEKVLAVLAILFGVLIIVVPYLLRFLVGVILIIWGLLKLLK